MTQKTPLYEGKAKVIFEGPEVGTLIQYFKDDFGLAFIERCLLCHGVNPSFGQIMASF